MSSETLFMTAVWGLGAVIVYLGFRDKQLTVRALKYRELGAYEKTDVVAKWQARLGRFWWLPKIAAHVAAAGVFIAVALLIPQIAALIAVTMLGVCAFYIDILKDNEEVIEALEEQNQWRSRHG